MTPRSRLWAEEFAILLGSEGAYRGEDVRRMTPEKRAWTLAELKKMRAAQRTKTGSEEAKETKGPTVRGRPVQTGRRD